MLMVVMLVYQRAVLLVDKTVDLMADKLVVHLVAQRELRSAAQMVGCWAERKADQTVDHLVAYSESKTVVHLAVRMADLLVA